MVVLPGVTFGLTTTNYSSPFRLGNILSAAILNAHPVNSLLHSIAQVCQQ